MKWKIANVEIKNQVVLAPMAGISNPAYMKICEEMGVGYAITELMSAEAIVRNNKKTFEMLNGLETLNVPVAIQIFGSNPSVMAEAAQKLTKIYNIKLLDINMGCPVPKVAIKSKAGSALLKNPDLIYEIVSSVTSSISIPVTVKIRSGWDSSSINAVQVAKICEKAGASAITIHARTRSQLYTGTTDLNIIKQVKEAVSIPVIGNGDIKDLSSAKHMLEYTNCDAIMIGRAAQGNPWIIKRIVTYLENGTILQEPTYEEKINMCKKHLEYLLKTKKEQVAILEMRSHIAWYVKGIPYHKEIQKLCFQAKTTQEITQILDNYLKKLYN